MRKGNELFGHSSDGKEELEIYYQMLIQGRYTDEKYILKFLKEKKIHSTSLDILTRLAEVFEQKKNIQICFAIFKSLSLISEDYLSKSIDYALSLGEIDYVENHAQKFLKNLLIRKNIRIAVGFLDRIEALAIGAGYTPIYRILFSLMIGDNNSLEKGVIRLGPNILEHKYFHLLINYADFKINQKWENNWFYNRLKLECLLFRIIEYSDNTWQLRRDFFYLLFDFKCRYPQDNLVFIWLSKYAGFFGNKTLSHAVKKYLDENRKVITKSDYMKVMNNLETQYIHRQEIAEEKLLEKKISSKGNKIIYAIPANNAERELNERCLLKVCELMDGKLLSGYYRDMFACFYMLDFFQVAQFILDRYMELLQDNSLEEKINVAYLRVEILVKQKKMWESMVFLENMLATFPLKDNERIGFNYRLAEIKLALNLNDEAKKIFQDIRKESPKYRLVQMRIKEIENIK